MRRNSRNELVFEDFPHFRPNLTPCQIFEMGSFGGTYWRPIESGVTKRKYKNRHTKYPKEWWRGIPTSHMTRAWEDYDSSINKYGVRVGTTLEFWEAKGWIDHKHPYGWVEWYCDFVNGARGDDDERQVRRWVNTAGPNSRFRKRLINMIKDKNTSFDNVEISPKIRQTLQHWGYQLSKWDV